MGMGADGWKCMGSGVDTILCARVFRTPFSLHSLLPDPCVHSLECAVLCYSTDKKEQAIQAKCLDALCTMSLRRHRRPK